MKFIESKSLPVQMPPQTDAELEAQAIAELECMQRARDAKRSNYRLKPRGHGYADHR